jgi:hypothetical protein
MERKLTPQGDRVPEKDEPQLPQEPKEPLPGLVALVIVIVGRRLLVEGGIGRGQIAVEPGQPFVDPGPEGLDEGWRRLDHGAGYEMIALSPRCEAGGASHEVAGDMGQVAPGEGIVVPPPSPPNLILAS